VRMNVYKPTDPEIVAGSVRLNQFHAYLLS
jgi:hypothetical protein